MEPKQEKPLTVRIALPPDADLSNPPYSLFNAIDLDAHLADEFDDDDYDGHKAEDCPDCNGQGEYDEWVPYGEGNVPMPIRCSCPCHKDDEPMDPLGATLSEAEQRERFGGYGRGGEE